MVKTVKNGNGTTHFFPVEHGKRTIGKAMAFVPAGVGLAEMAPMAVYVHGKSFANEVVNVRHSDMPKTYAPEFI